MAAYHAQQAAEKALKAYLTAHATLFRPTHDLVELRAQCQAIDAAFGEFTLMAQLLTPFATQFRYPGGPLAPSQAIAQQAIQDAERIVQFVRQQIDELLMGDRRSCATPGEG